MSISAARPLLALAFSLLVAACGATVPTDGTRATGTVPGYEAIQEGYITIDAIDPRYLDEPNRRTTVAYSGSEEPGTIIVDPYAKFLYFVESPGTAIRYSVAVGREGRGFSGEATIGRKAEWPSWAPTENMIRSEPDVYGPFAKGIPGGKANPLGARALYLYRGGTDTYYRIHGTNDPATIGNQGSAGCIRLFNHDIIHLHELASVGAKVIVRTYEESVAAEGEEMANRGGEMTPKPIDAEAVYAFVEEEKKRKAEYEALN